MKKNLINIIISLFVLFICSSCAIQPGKLYNSRHNDSIMKADIDNHTIEPVESKTLTKKITERYVNLSVSKRADIASRINSEKKHDFTFMYFDGPDGYLPDLSSTCYGEYSGCSVWFLAGQACVETIIEVGGYKFPFGSSFSITVEKAMEIYDLKDAYEKSLLTEKDIAELYEIHKEFISEYYNGASRYKEKQ